MKYLEIVFNRPLRQSFSYRGIDDSPAAGRRVHAMLGKKRLMGYVVDESEQPPDLPGKLKSIEGFVDKQAVYTPDLIELARWMAQFYMCSIGEALAAIIPGGKRDREFTFRESVTDPPPAELADEQEEAVRGIVSCQSGNFYLHGITGSGKTEVFLRVAEKTIAEGRGVIYLVPEISLTHQLVDAVHQRFQTETAVLHSGLSPGQRLAQWRRILEGEALFVIGARSAVFAPLRSIGLIILDEEHEGSYKSGSTPDTTPVRLPSFGQENTGHV